MANSAHYITYPLKEMSTSTVSGGKKVLNPKQLLRFKSKDPVHHRTHDHFLLVLAATSVESRT